MPTYLLTNDVLNVSVSCFANYRTAANPVTINLLTWLTSSKHRTKIETLRLVENKAKRDAIKATLPAITPSGIFTYRKESHLVAGSHTQLIQFDIDQKDNPRIRNYADLKAQISKLPFVAYCGLSASGKGYWGLVPIAYPERHSQHVDALQRVFAHYRIQIDTLPRNVASLRGYSYDPAPYFPERVTVFELFDEPSKPKPRRNDEPPKPKPRPFTFTINADVEQTRVESCIAELNRHGIDLTTDYADWYAIGCGLANAFGERGRDYYHYISQHYPKYHPTQTDKQFTACLKGSSQATLGTFFHLCKQAGIEWKDLMTLSERPLPGQPYTAPVNIKTIADDLDNPGSDLTPDEPQFELLVVEPCDTYPAEWDEPNPVGATPTIRVKTFHEFQQQHPYFRTMGISSRESEP